MDNVNTSHINDSDIDLILSISDTSYEAEEQEICNLPYRYEPYLSDTANSSEHTESSEGSNSETEIENHDVGLPDLLDQNDRLGNTEWCSCENCSTDGLVKAVECVCCRELEKVAYKVGQAGCITGHPSFAVVCLHPDVLDVAYSQYKQDHGELNKTINERRRYTAYRQFVRWCWDYLGRKIRVPIPSCVITKVRSTFPSPNYKGLDLLSE